MQDLVDAKTFNLGLMAEQTGVLHRLTRKRSSQSGRIRGAYGILLDQRECDIPGNAICVVQNAVGHVPGTNRGLNSVE